MKTTSNIKKWQALTFLALSVSLIVIDGTIVNVSLPVIMKDLHFNFTNAEWIVTLYSLVFSSLLISTGKIADMLGRRKMLVTGIIVFIIGSIMASMSNTLPFMLTARFIQGIGGAITLPTTLSTMNTIFKGRDRIIAFAVWGSVISGMAALGPLLGGFFTTYLTWRWIFWINIPIGIIIIIGAFMYIPETLGKQEKGFDFIGLILSIITFGSIVYGLIEGKNYGWWHPKNGAITIGSLSIIPYALILGIISLIILIIWEEYLSKKQKPSLIALNLFSFKSFSIGILIACIVAIAEFGLLFLLPLYLQNVLFMSAMKSGLILALMGIGAFISGGLAEPFVRKTSPAIVVSSGLILEAISLFGFYFTIKPSSSTFMISLWIFIYGFGLGFASAQLTSIVMVDVPDNQAGQGSSIQSTVRQLGSALGIAIIGTVFVSFLWHDIPGTLSDTGLPKIASTQIEKSVISSAGATIPQINKSNIPNDLKYEITTKLSHNFTHSIVKTMGITAGILVISVILTFILPK